MRNNLKWFLIVVLVIGGILILNELRVNNVFSPKPAVEQAAQEHLLPEFDVSKFDGQSVQITNEWLPLKPGTNWVYEGTTTEEGKSFPHRIEYTVTDLTKTILGVDTVVVWTLDFSDNELVEKEIAFFAQDKDGNVWYFGEHPEEYEDGKFVAAPTWVAGQKEAKPGIAMWAQPSINMSSYFQGWGPAVDWSDYAKIDQTGQKKCFPLNCYKDVIVIKESSLAEPNIYQLKYFAKATGNIGVDFQGEDKTQEILELVEFRELNSEELAEVTKKALAMEQHAYEININAYGQTKPAEQRLGTESATLQHI